MMGTSHENAATQSTKALIRKRDEILQLIHEQEEILRQNANIGMRASLVDWQGFPRGDIDIVAVRQARIRIIQLLNDHKHIVDDISRGLEQVFPAVNSNSPSSSSPSDTSQVLAIVNAISPNSPAELLLLHTNRNNYKSLETIHHSFHRRLVEALVLRVSSNPCLEVFRVQLGVTMN